MFYDRTRLETTRKNENNYSKRKAELDKLSSHTSKRTIRRKIEGYTTGITRKMITITVINEAK